MNCKYCKANCTGAKQDKEIALCLGYDPPKTNADYIRSMTDEELADWYFDKFFPYVPYCSILDECPEHDDCKICLLGWLKEESEEEDESR